MAAQRDHVLCAERVRAACEDDAPPPAICSGGASRRERGDVLDLNANYHVVAQNSVRHATAGKAFAIAFWGAPGRVRPLLQHVTCGLAPNTSSFWLQRKWPGQRDHHPARASARAGRNAANSLRKPQAY